jgi:AraC-like DNA-binding protein
VETLERWDVGALEGDEKLEAFGDQLAETHTRCAMRPTQRPFDELEAAIARSSFGELSLVQATVPACAGRRGRREIDDETGGVIGVQVVMQGREIIGQGDELAMLEPGAVVVWDASRPIEFEILDPLVKCTLVLPREQLVTACPRVERLVGVPFRSDAPVARLLSGFFAALARELPGLDDAGRRAASRATLELVRGALEPRLLDDRDAAQEAMLLRVRDYIEIHLRDTTLRPAGIAHANALSLRSLHALFEKSGESVSCYVRRRRLDRCREDLASPNGGSITAIAHRWGFNDSAHFSRVFRQHFGCTPSEARASGAGLTWAGSYSVC